MEDSWEFIFMEDVQSHIEEHGVSGIEEFFKTKLGRWKDVEINIGITGNSGVGKSSFINAIRGLGDEDEGAAETDVTETTREPTIYPHPTNEKIKFWDLPGIGTPNYPDLETYCEKVELEKYDTFLILTMKRFTENDRLLAKKVEALGKSFFFIRTHIDVDYGSQRRKKSFNEEAMLKTIREDCFGNLNGLTSGDVFLISNLYPAKWDFARLTQAILDVLPFRQRECLTLSLGVLTSLSSDMLKRKAELLRGRIWMVASASAAAAAVPVPGLNVAVDLALLTSEVTFYKSQLGLPDENSYEFRRMAPESQEKVRKFCVTSAVQLASFLATYTAGSAVEEFARFIPFIGLAIAGGISFSSTYYFLHQCVNELEGTALSFLDEMTAKAVDFDID